jgi:hypothetical protein
MLGLPRPGYDAATEYHPDPAQPGTVDSATAAVCQCDNGSVARRDAGPGRSLDDYDRLDYDRHEYDDVGNDCHEAVQEEVELNANADRSGERHAGARRFHSGVGSG